MKTTPWEVNSKNVSDAYIAGFLDGDGSIVVGVEKRPDRRRFPFRVRPKISFSQHSRHRNLLVLIQETLGKVGNIRYIRTHNLCDLVISKRSDVKATLERLLSHIILKQRQARTMLAMLDVFESGKVNTRSSLSDKDYEKLFAMAKEIRNMNSGAGGKKSYEIINPVTT